LWAPWLDGLSWAIASPHDVPRWAIREPIGSPKTRIRFPAPPLSSFLTINLRRFGPGLTAIGNSLGIVIEKPILELLDIQRDTELEMRTDGQRLIIEPVRKSKNQRVKVALERALIAHDESLRKLAK
jgi:antitoxin MazE